MIETYDERDPEHGLPLFSLYGKVRRPTEEMLSTFDLLLVDLQDVGCRIYTYLTTLFYLMEDCAKAGKELWILDRPNPAGRPAEGSLLRPGWESFVGMGPVLMRHGMTLGELGHWIQKKYKFDLNFDVISMTDYRPRQSPDFGWPQNELCWVNPSPNIPTLTSTRCFAGTVLLEGTSLSEGRGSTRALEIFGAPGLPVKSSLEWMKKKAPHWLEGCVLRPAFFEPTFHKHAHKTCAGFQIHTDTAVYDPEKFKPYRLILLFLKSLRALGYEGFEWRQPPYEYEHDRLPVDLLSGGSFAREWVDDPKMGPDDLEEFLDKDEKAWQAEREACLLYK